MTLQSKVVFLVGVLLPSIAPAVVVEIATDGKIKKFAKPEPLKVTHPPRPELVYDFKNTTFVPQPYECPNCRKRYEKVGKCGKSECNKAVLVENLEGISTPKDEQQPCAPPITSDVESKLADEPFVNFQGLMGELDQKDRELERVKSQQSLVSSSLVKQLEEAQTLANQIGEHRAELEQQLANVRKELTAAQEEVRRQQRTRYKPMELSFMHGPVYDGKRSVLQKVFGGNDDHRIYFGSTVVQSQQMLVLYTARGGGKALLIQDITLTPKPDSDTTLKIQCAGKPSYKKTYYFSDSRDRDHFVATIQELQNENRVAQ